MSFDHSMSLCCAQVKEGVSKEQVREALMPVLKVFGADKKDSAVYGCEFIFNEETGDVYLDTYGEVGDSFDDKVRDVAANLNEIVLEAGQIELRDHDTGDLDNAITIIEFGPSDEAINAYVRKRDIDAALILIGNHLPQDKIAAIRAMIDS